MAGLHQRAARAAAITALAVAAPALAGDAVSYEYVLHTEPGEATLETAQILAKRLDAAGLSATVEPADWNGRLRVVVEEPPDFQAVARLMMRTGKLALHPVIGEAPAAGCEYAASEGEFCLPAEDAPALRLAAAPLVGTGGVSDASVAFDDGGHPVVAFTMSPRPAADFCDFTTAHVGKRIAIVVEGAVLSAPVVQAPICGGKIQVAGSFDMAEARGLAAAMSADSLPALVEVISIDRIEPTVTPSAWRRWLGGVWSK